MRTKTPSFPERESRFLAASVELRAAAETEQAPIIRGYAAKFNSPSDNLGSEDDQILEVIAPGAFDEVLNDDVRALFNHEAELILARSKDGKGTLQIGVDEVGLWYEFEAPDTQAGRDLVVSLRRGDVDQSSFSFSVAAEGQSWSQSQIGDGPTIYRRTITKIKRLFDVSPVTYPAYPDASVALRSLQEFRQTDLPPAPPAAPEPPPEAPSLSYWQQRMGLIDKTAD